MKELLNQAFKEGLNDTVTDEVLYDAAEAYVDSCTTKDLTDDERQEIHLAYVKGFISGYQK